jgi:superfamily II DNA/RNA helicase
MGSHMRIEIRDFLGGTPLRDDIMALRAGVIHIASGTPHRLHDLILRGELKADNIKLVVFDDSIRGFENPEMASILLDIVHRLPDSVQVVVLFSGDLTPSLAELETSSKLMKDKGLLFDNAYNGISISEAMKSLRV